MTVQASSQPASSVASEEESVAEPAPVVDSSASSKKKKKKGKKSKDADPDNKLMGADNLNIAGGCGPGQSED